MNSRTDDGNRRFSIRPKKTDERLEGKGRLTRFPQTDSEIDSALDVLETVRLKVDKPAYRAQIAQVLGDVLRERFIEKRDVADLHRAVAAYDSAIAIYSGDPAFQQMHAEALIARSTTRTGIAAMTDDAGPLDSAINDARTALELANLPSGRQSASDLRVIFNQVVGIELDKTELRINGKDALILALEVKGDLTSEPAAYEEALSLASVKERDKDRIWAVETKRWAEIARKLTLITRNDELRVRAGSLEEEADEICAEENPKC